MRNTASEDLSDIYFPLGMLVWFGTYPAAFSMIARARRAIRNTPGWKQMHGIGAEGPSDVPG